MKWYQSKTNITAVGGILGAIAGFLTGALDPASAIQAGVVSLMAIFMRQGIAKGK